MADGATIDQLRKMTAAELEEGKKEDNLYFQPPPSMLEPVHGENNSQSLFISNEGYATGHISSQDTYEEPSATTTTTIRRTSTTTTTTSTLSGQTTTTTSTSTTTTTTLTPTTTTTTTTTTSTTTTTTVEPTTTTTSTTSTTTTTLATTTTTTTTSTTTTTVALIQAKFNFNLTAQSIAGWNDVSGSPDAGVISVTDTINGTNYVVESIATKWVPFGSSSSNTNGTVGSNSDFPANVIISYWFTYSNTYTSTGANLKISSLTPSVPYQLKLIGSRAGGGVPTGTRLMEFHVSQVATVGDPSEQNSGIDPAPSYAAKDSLTTQAFTITSNASGEIYVGVNQSVNGNGTNTNQFGYLNGLIVTKL